MIDLEVLGAIDSCRYLWAGTYDYCHMQNEDKSITPYPGRTTLLEPRRVETPSHSNIDFTRKRTEGINPLKIYTPDSDGELPLETAENDRQLVSAAQHR